VPLMTCYRLNITFTFTSPQCIGWKLRVLRTGGRLKLSILISSWKVVIYPTVFCFIGLVLGAI